VQFATDTQRTDEAIVELAPKVLGGGGNGGAMQQTGMERRSNVDDDRAAVAMYLSELKRWRMAAD